MASSSVQNGTYTEMWYQNSLENNLYHGNFRKVRRLVDRYRASLDFVTSTGNTPLTLSLYNYREPYRANANDKGPESEHLQLIEYVLDRSSPDVINYSSPNGLTALGMIMYYGYLETLISHHSHIILKMLQRGATIPTKTWKSPLLVRVCSASHPNVELIKYLVNVAKVNVNEIDKTFGSGDHTALSRFVSRVVGPQFEEVVQILLAGGAIPNLCGTILYDLVRYDHEILLLRTETLSPVNLTVKDPIVNLMTSLVQEYHLDVNGENRNREHTTPLHKAIIDGNRRLVHTLLTLGASTTVLNSRRQTCLEVAQLAANPEDSRYRDTWYSYVSPSHRYPLAQEILKMLQQHISRQTLRQTLYASGTIKLRCQSPSPTSDQTPRVLEIPLNVARLSNMIRDMIDLGIDVTEEIPISHSAEMVNLVFEWCLYHRDNDRTRDNSFPPVDFDEWDQKFINDLLTGTPREPAPFICTPPLPAIEVSSSSTGTVYNAYRALNRFLLTVSYFDILGKEQMTERWSDDRVVGDYTITFPDEPRWIKSKKMGPGRLQQLVQCGRARLVRGKTPAQLLFMLTQNDQGVSTFVPTAQNYVELWNEHPWLKHMKWKETASEESLQRARTRDMQEVEKLLAEEIIPELTKLQAEGYRPTIESYQSHNDYLKERYLPRPDTIHEVLTIHAVEVSRVDASRISV